MSDPTGNKSVDNLIGLMRAGKLDRYLTNIQAEAIDRQKRRMESVPITIGEVYKIGASIRPKAMVGVRVEVLSVLRTRVKVKMLEDPRGPQCRFQKDSVFLINKTVLETL